MEPCLLWNDLWVVGFHLSSLCMVLWNKEYILFWSPFHHISHTPLLNVKVYTNLTSYLVFCHKKYGNFFFSVLTSNRFISKMTHKNKQCLPKFCLPSHPIVIGQHGIASWLNISLLHLCQGGRVWSLVSSFLKYAGKKN